MNINLIGKTKDLRTNTVVIYAQLPIGDYLNLVGENYDEFEIQRRRQKHKAYERMREDIINGALLPSITLAVRPDVVEDYDKYLNIDHEITEAASEGINELLQRKDQVRIIDGLQRTHILKEISQDKHMFDEHHKLLVEFWFEANMYNLIYRIIVLNAGQKPMSLRHQIELLFGTISNQLEKDIANIEIFTERDEKRRTQPRKYPLERIVTAYQSFMLKDPETDKQSLIAKKISEEEGILALTETDLGKQFEEFTNYLKIYAELDDKLHSIYPGQREVESPINLDDNIKIPGALEWFGSDNTMKSIFAAISKFGHTDQDRTERVRRSLDKLLEKLNHSEDGDDPLHLAYYQAVTENFPTRKVNVGVATRKLITNVFYEFFRSEGTEELSELWIKEAP